MRFLTPAFVALSVLLGLVQALDGYTVPRGSPGYQRGNSTQAIQFDPRSFWVDDKRIFLYSGEFHPWRIPVPELWRDILQKMKAAGFNAVSIYLQWGLIEGKRGVLNWEHYRDLTKFYDIAKEEGIFVVARPGPYINAETTGGGFPGWLANNPAVARTTAPGYVESWQKYIKEFSELTKPYQYPDGPVLFVQAENEFYRSNDVNPTATDYMAVLEDAFRAGGISKIPLMHNDVWPSGNYAGSVAPVDVYGFDAYPNGFDCSNTTKWNELPDYFVSNREANAPWNVMYIPEFQGGALDGWGGVGYDKCYELTGADFANVFYKANVAFGSRAMSFYMLTGGTNWGNSAYPGVYTSYDYGAAIRETRSLSDKYSEDKLQGLFYQASPSLLNTTILGTGAGAPYTDTASISVTILGGGGAANYYVTRQSSNNVTTPTAFKLNVNTTLGPLTIPQGNSKIVLDGRESKIIVSEYSFGKSVLRYSTAEVLTQTTHDGNDIVVLYVKPGQSFETLVHGPTMGTPKITGASGITATAKDSSVTISGSPKGITTVSWGKTRVIVTDKTTAKTFWQPRLTGAHKYDVSPDAPSILVVGPYLVRSASLHGSVLELVGDTTGVLSLSVIAPQAVKSIKWNGATVQTKPSSFGIGVTGNIGKALDIKVPDIKSLEWKSFDSLPEVAVNFDDSTWVVANKTSTLRPMKPFSGKYMLYAGEYGFHAGSFVYRGYFTGKATGLDISVHGGNGFGFSTYLNGHFLGSGQSQSDVLVNSTFTFDPSFVVDGKNVLTVVSDSSGLDGDWDSNDAFKSPRGIRGYKLLGGGDIDQWKLTGNLGGEDYPDQVRGPYNEGGFWAERIGAILPGFDDSKWKKSSPFEGISTAGIQAYRTHLPLSVPANVDTTLAFEFTRTPESNYRAILFVNGWQFGRFSSNYGPQTSFPVPEGILKHNGDNEIVVLLWSLDAQGAKIADLKLVPTFQYTTGRKAIAPVLSPVYKELRR